MSEKKTLKRAVKAIWDDVKELRSERRALYTPADLLLSADELERHAGALREASNQLSALSAMPPSEPETPIKRKRGASKN